MDKVDFISAAGTSPADTLRHGNPSKVITPLATLRMEKQLGLLRLESCHAPATVELVVEQTGFDLGDVSGVGAVAPPTEQELGLLRDTVRRRMIETDTYPEWARENLGGLRVA